MASRRRHPNDPAHPDFPHGTLSGYQKGCHEECCRRPARRARQAAQYRRNTGQLAPTDYVDATQALEHLAKMAARGDTPAQIAALVGLEACYVRNLVSGRHKPAKMTVRAVTGILAIDLDLDTPAKDQLPVARYWQRIYSLAAMGYPLRWIARQVGINKFGAHGDRATVSLDTFEKVDRLYRTVGHIPAEDNPDVHTSPHYTSIARTTARRRGYFPPACYTDDGVLIPEAVRFEDLEKRKRERDRMARERLEVLRLSLEHEMAPADVTARTGTSGALVQKIRAETGLKFYTDNSAVPGRGQRRRVMVRPEHQERAAQVRAVLDVFYADPDADPYETCRGLGLMRADKHENLDKQVRDRAARLAA